MPIHVKWVNAEQTVVWYDIEGNWTWDEYYPAYDKAIQMMAAKGYTVDVITNLLDAKGAPPNALSHLRSFNDRRPDNIGVNVLITENAFVIAIVSVAMRMLSKFGENFRIASTVDEAHRLIEQAVAARTR